MVICFQWQSVLLHLPYPGLISQWILPVNSHPPEKLSGVV